MNKGYHSTQKKYLGAIPRSEFYGVAAGYALGLIISGLFRLETQLLELALAVVGFLIGYYVDYKYYRVKDEPAESKPEAVEEKPAEEIAVSSEGALSPDESPEEDLSEEETES